LQQLYATTDEYVKRLQMRETVFRVNTPLDGRLLSLVMQYL
jgi:hypothetical protein